VVGGALVCHTRGPHGAVVAGREVGPEPVRVPAPPTEEVDPTGAGDTFAAAFACVTRAGAGPVAAARVACAVASRSVGVLGAMELRLGPGDLAWAEPEEGSAGPRRAQRPQRPSGPRRAQRPPGPGRAQGP
jgi:sugar/nucleoside kinase (ribokinase family)